MKLDVMEGTKARMHLNVGTKGWIQQQVPSWENVTVDTFVVPIFTSSIIGVLSSRVRAVRLTLLFEMFVDTYIARSMQKWMPNSVSVHPLSFPYERQIKEGLHQL